MLDNRNLKYQIVTAGAALLAGVIVKAALSKAWKMYSKSDPPQNPESADVSWSEAITWTVASSVVMGIGSLLARRGAASFVPKPPILAEEPLV